MLNSELMQTYRKTVRAGARNARTADPRSASAGTAVGATIRAKFAK